MRFLHSRVGQVIMTLSGEEEELIYCGSHAKVFIHPTERILRQLSGGVHFWGMQNVNFISLKHA